MGSMSFLRQEAGLAQSSYDAEMGWTAALPFPEVWLRTIKDPDIGISEVIE